jgi:nitroreductase
MSRRTLLRRAGLGMGTLAVAGAGALGYRAYDQGVLEAGHGPAYEPWRTWDEQAGVRALVAAAIHAPSSHNAQPWRFEVSDDGIDLHADPRRHIGAVDPFARERDTSLGAALENLVIAARANGSAPQVELLPAGPDRSHVARIRLLPAREAHDPLYPQIARRRTNRYAYAQGRAVAPAALRAMAALGDPATTQARLFWFTDRRSRLRLGELLVAATEALIDDPAQSASDYAWLRLRWDELQRRRDGITLDAAGLPDLTVALGKLLPAQSQAASGDAWLEATRVRHTRTAAGYGIVAVRDVADRRHRLEGGRLLERIHLWATGHDVALHHMNQLTERADREQQLALTPRFGDALRDLVPSGWQALATFRVGHPTRIPDPSPRRPVAAVLAS